MSRLRKVLLNSSPVVGLIGIVAIFAIRARRIPDHFVPVPTYFPGAILIDRKAERIVDVSGLPVGVDLTASYKIDRSRHNVVVDFNKTCKSYGLEPSGSSWSGHNSTGGEIRIGVAEEKGQTRIYYHEFFVGENDWWDVFLHKLDVTWGDNTN